MGLKYRMAWIQSTGTLFTLKMTPESQKKGVDMACMRLATSLLMAESWLNRMDTRSQNKNMSASKSGTCAR